MAYTYPENRLEIIDGSLRPLDINATDTVLVIERSFTGPTNTIYKATDLTVAKNIYGDFSPLTTLAARVRAAGAENIALYRIGGGAYEYVDIFGPDSSLRLTEESTKAADNINIYIGPEPKNPSRDCLIAYEGKRIFYSNVLGGEVSSSKIQVINFDKLNNTLRVGTLDNPVPFTEIMNHLGAPAIVASVKPTKGLVDGSEYIKVNVSTITGFDVQKDSLGSVTITKAGETKSIPYTVSADKTSLLLVRFVDGVSEAVKVTDTLEIKFLKTLDKEALEEKGIIYTKGKDSMNASYKELYEIVDQALESLELVSTKVVVVGDWFNLPNIAHGSTAPNRLEYLSKGSDEDGYPTYEWSANKYLYRKQGSTTETVTDISQAELDLNGKPVIVKYYNEVDFTHRLGMFANSKLADGKFVNVVIGVEGPVSRTPRAILNWVGTEPSRDLAGNIVVNGTGLLGHRLMVGSTDYAGGYFATSNGYVDGDILVDSTGFPVDVGKHLSIVVSQVGIVTNASLSASGAAGYAGLVAKLGPGQSTTNQAINNMFLTSDLKEYQRRALSSAGYVVFMDKPKGLTVYSGDVATRENSDFDYISTAITIAETSRLITETTDPYIGQGIDIVTLAALQTALTTALANAQREGWFISYNFKIRRSGYNTLLIPFVIEAKDELRQISNVVRLTRNDNFIEL